MTTFAQTGSVQQRARVRTAPFVLLSALLVATLLATGAIVYLAVMQPWLGLKLLLADDTVRISSLQRQDLPPIESGYSVLSLEGANGSVFALSPEDMVEEPDTLESYEAINSFLARQQQLHDILSTTPVRLTIEDSQGERSQVSVSPQPSRPLLSLPVEFWIQLFVGIGGVLVGGLVWSLRRTEPSAFFFFVSGAGLMISAGAAAIYSTRELALDATLLRTLSAFNYLGTHAFGAALISLLLVYPHRIASLGVIAAVWGATAVFATAHLAQLLPSQTLGSYGPMTVMFFIIGVLVAVQIYRSRRDPLARAALGWFGLSILCGTSVFIFAIAAPLLTGSEPQVSQAYAFGIILVIYAGLALGVARYRLFDLDVWAFRLGSYLLGALLLVVFDAFLIYAVAIERVPAFGLSLLIVALVYLPLRSAVGDRLLARPELGQHRFKQIVDIALAQTLEQQRESWHRLLDQTFAPLAIEPATGAKHTTLVEDGLGMMIPGPPPLPDLHMRFARGGRRLFSRRDVEQGEEIVALMSHAIESRYAHEAGVREERTRIAQDLHDNIGAQLLRTLHAPDTERKNALVGETLSDLRDIISNARDGGIDLEELLAELRYETEERVSLAEMHLNWSARGADDVIVGARVAHTLRSIVREAASNAIRHAGGETFKVAVQVDRGTIALSIADDGQGFDATLMAPGNGLGNMRARLLSHDGTLSISGQDGVSIEARLPISDSES
ncbi:hypothetical protein GCM10007989_03500 [Devosia pacifica]|uniref:Histidine kinase domain-containing protein n=1 Tax=Devosia pacifica TaxID=1335967 RepID=A0A918RVJ9_9HYPH|nr:ATP-binding protein [Devosia pacifica]GHA12350.1 hypothetical protein GCM10007989_03500 [Devosia pacifica]